MGGSESTEKDITQAQKQRLQQFYTGGAALQTYDHPDEGIIYGRHREIDPYEDVKQYEAAVKLSTAKNSTVIASNNDAYIITKTIKVSSDVNYSNCYNLSFNYKIAVKSTVIVSLAWIPHKPDSINPFEYETCASSELSTRSYEWDPVIHGTENTISFVYNPSDYSTLSMTEFSTSFYPLLVHIYAMYDDKTKQNENFLYFKFSPSMNSVTLEKNIVRMNGKNYEMKTVYGLSKKDETDVCLVCIENPKNIVLKPWFHMCICSTCAEPMLRNKQKCPVCRGPITEIEKIDVVADKK